MPKTALLDSSVWIEIFGQGPHVRTCEVELGNSHPVIVPTVVLFEVYKKIASRASESDALLAVAALNQHQVVSFDSSVALLAADLSMTHKLAMADSIVLAHAQIAKAKLITMDQDFAKIPDVKILALAKR